MTRPINFRPILLCAISLIFGILLYSYSPSLKIWTILLPIIILSLISLLFFLIVEKDKRITVATTCVACLCFAFLGSILLGVSVRKTEKGKVEDGIYEISGVVDSVSYKDGIYYFGVTNCKYGGESGGDLFVYGINQKVSLYDEILLNGYVYGVERVEDKSISSSMINGRSMLCSRVYDFQITGKQNSLASKFKVKTDLVFEKVLGERSGILSALLRGDVSEMKETVSAFRLVGIAHVFAVSGMHIGLVFTALSFLLGKIKLNRYVKTAITCIFLFLYSYLCGFTSSSLRASITCSCVALCKLTGEKYDGVNALSESAIIVLVLSPTEVFSAGFILSYAISFSITVFAPTFKEWLKFLPEQFASAISVLFASQAVALPLSVSFFGSFSLVSFIANFLLLPVVTIIFYFVFIGALICVILPINELIALFIPQILIVGTTGIVSFL